MRVRPEISSIAESLKIIRHHLHRSPQTAFEEEIASSMIKNRLGSLSIPFESVAGTGVVGTINGHQGPGRVIGLRADMDALNVAGGEKADVTFRSVFDGKMHACGHDGHMTTLLAVAQYFATHRHFSGALKLVFQPAEESIGGAERMVKEGLLERHKMNAIYGWHNWPWMKLGQIAVHKDTVMGSNVNYQVIIEGRGGHGAIPESANNPIFAASEILRRMAQLPKEDDLKDRCIVTPCHIEAGNGGSFSVIPGAAILSGTTRMFDPAVIAPIQEKIREIAAHVAKEFNVKAEVKIPDITYSTINTPHEAALSRSVASEIVGSSNVITGEPSRIVEDFGHLLTSVGAGSYVWIGQGVDDPGSLHNKDLHNAGYGYNDNVTPVAAEYFVRVAERELGL